mgnify:CR=1 FL=1
MKKMSLNDGSPFLLTPLREGRPGGDRKVQHHRQISTHAPAGGATCRRFARMRQRLWHFYSRPCGRGDRNAHYQKTYGKEISTHAPAGGATCYNRSRGWYSIFLLTPLREGRRLSVELSPYQH